MKKWKIGIAAAVILILILCLVVMSADQYWWGDEVFSYFMANSHDKAFVFSDGRVVSFFKDRIFGDSFSATLKNFGAFILDLVKNFRNADYFTYPRPTETGWYTGADIANCFRVLPGQRFDYGTVYFHSMGDDANSFLFYSLLHTVGSLFPSLSDSPWAGYILNLTALMFVLFLLTLICRRLGLDERETFLAILVYGISNACLLQVTNIRPYMLATIFQLWLYYLHLHLFESIEHGQDKRFSKTCLILFFVYVVGYISHYTTLAWAGFLGVNTVLLYWKKNRLQGKHYIRQYILSGALAIMAGFVIDPVSIMGLALKFFGYHVTKPKSMFNELYLALIKFITIDRTGLILIGTFILFCLILLMAQPEKSGADKAVLLLGSILLEEGLLLLAATKMVYFTALYPLIMLVLVHLASRALSLCCRRIPSGFLRALIACCLIAAYGVCSLRSALDYKELEGREQKEVMAVLESHKTADLVYIRGKSDYYEFVPVLRNYENNLVLTPWKGDYHGLENTEEYQSADELAVVSTDKRSVDGEILKWMQENGFSTQKVLFDGEGYHVYYLAREAQGNAD